MVATTGQKPILDAAELQQDGGPFAKYDGTTEQLARSVQVEMTEQPQNDWAVANLFIDVVSSRSDEGFALTLQTDRSDYRPGDTMTVTLTAERDCILTLVNVEPAQHSATVLYPNRVIETVRLRAGQATVLPGADSTLQLDVLGPPGKQTLHAVCTEDPKAVGIAVSGLPLRAVYPVMSAVEWNRLQQTVQNQPRTARTSVVFEVQP